MGRAARVPSRTIVATVAAVAMSVSSTAEPRPERPQATRDPGVVLEWNDLAFKTIGVDGKQPPPVTELYLALVSLAVYNAVVTIEGDGEPTLGRPGPRGRASSDVAAATAAHDVLLEYFPSSQPALDGAYDSWLAGVAAGGERDRGQAVGRDAADALIASRAGVAPGVLPPAPPLQPRPDGATWVPSETGAFVAPWLGFTRPVLIDSPTQFAPDGPDALTSASYAADVHEVQTMGAKTGALRSPQQTDLALFFSDNPVRQYQDAMRDLAVARDLDIVEAARMFAAANTAGADALITCWRSKQQNNFWRPWTAIRQAGGDGNPATTEDPAWTPLLLTPPYPEYPSGHACVSAGTARALKNLFGNFTITIRSVVPNLQVTSREYSSARNWMVDVTNARIWLGIHFRDAMDDGRRIGRQVADEIAERFRADG